MWKITKNIKSAVARFHVTESDLDDAFAPPSPSRLRTESSGVRLREFFLLFAFILIGVGAAATWLTTLDTDIVAAAEIVRPEFVGKLPDAALSSFRFANGQFSFPETGLSLRQETSIRSYGAELYAEFTKGRFLERSSDSRDFELAAMAAYEHHDYAAAFDFADSSLLKNPNSLFAHRLRGYAGVYLGNFSEARTSLLYLLGARRPSFYIKAQVSNALGVLFLRIGDRATSESYFATAAMLNEQFGWRVELAAVLNNRAELCAAMQFYDGARADYLKAARLLQPEQEAMASYRISANRALLDIESSKSRERVLAAIRALQDLLDDSQGGKVDLSYEKAEIHDDLASGFERLGIDFSSNLFERHESLKSAKAHLDSAIAYYDRSRNTYGIARANLRSARLLGSPGYELAVDTATLHDLLKKRIDYLVEAQSLSLEKGYFLVLDSASEMLSTLQNSSRDRVHQLLFVLKSKTAVGDYSAEATARHIMEVIRDSSSPDALLGMVQDSVSNNAVYRLSGAGRLVSEILDVGI